MAASAAVLNAQMNVDATAGDDGWTAVTLQISEGDVADAYGNSDVMVLSTPALVELFERAAIAVATAHLHPGERSVGTVVDVQHVAPAPLLSTVRVAARLNQIDGRKLVFDLQAWCDDRLIATGRHVRAIVDLAQFHQRAGVSALCATEETGA